MKAFLFITLFATLATNSALAADKYLCRDRLFQWIGLNPAQVQVNETIKFSGVVDAIKPASPYYPYKKALLAI